MDSNINNYNKYDSEVKQKWGNTQAYNEHKLKTKDYSHEKWDNLLVEMDNIFKSFSDYMLTEDTSAEKVQDLVKKLQDFITENYYNCSDEILNGLGQMYIQDERFKKNIDKHREGTANFVSEAINVYTNRSLI